MLTNILPLSHQEQQAATEQIHQLIATGMSSRQAIASVAQEIREHRRRAACHHSLKNDPLQN